MGIKQSKTAKQTRHLPYDHPSMAAVREWVGTAVEANQVHPRLIAHFDQVWTTLYEPADHCLWKPPELEGCHDPRTKRPSPSKAQMLNSIREALGMEISKESKSDKKHVKPAALCAQSTLVPVDYQRHPRTTTTLSFCDGKMGRAFVTAAPSVVSWP